MENISKIILKYTYTNGDTETKIVNLSGEEDVCSQYINAKIKTVAKSSVSETAIELSAVEEKPLKWFDVEFFLTSKIATPELYMYNNATISNDWVNTFPFEKAKELITRDVLTLENKENGRTFGVGFVTAERFWAYMKSRPWSITLRYSMEDKPLKKGETYTMERFIFGEGVETKAFLEGYADRVAEIYNIDLSKKLIYSGWCSWSCFYKGINEENITRVTEEMDGCFGEKKTRLVQLDDGWQIGPTSFPGIWKEDLEKFPGGVRKMADLANSKGMDFGLWLSPFLMAESSPFREELKHMELKNSRNVHRNINALDIAKPEMLERVKNIFKWCSEDLKSDYYKLDFLILSLRREGAVEDFVTYEEDYSVAVYKKALKTVRETIGDDRFMLLCGAPLLESAGIFDGTRIGSDIAWGRSKAAPTGWTIVRNCIVNTMLRYFYHGKVFINDPDGVILRDTNVARDGYDATYSETRAWSTATAMSGGLILENDVPGTLSESRKQLFEDILPVYGKAAQPLDFYQQPYPTIAYIPVDENTKLVSAYNFGDKIDDIKLPIEKLGFEGDTLVVKCWEREIAGIHCGEYTEADTLPHSGFVYLLKKCPDVPCALYVDCNVYGGVDMIEQSFGGKKLTVKANEKLGMCKNRNLYVYAPAGFECEGEIVLETEKGRVYKACELVPGKVKEIVFEG